MFTGYAHPAKLKRLLQLLVSLSLLGTMFFVNVPAAHAEDVGGPIFDNTTWTLAGSPYIVISPVLVMEGVTLTIEPGVVVKFNSHKALQVDGELHAVGTSGSPITFTSNVGTTPGDWDYIVFSDTSVDAVYDVGGNYQSGSILQYVIIEYAGGASVDNNGALRLNSAAPFITHCTIRNNASAAIIGFNYSNAHMFKATFNTIMNNAGAGISVDGINPSAEITDSTISGNIKSPSSLGGGISVTGVATSLISRNVIQDNTRDWSGSGLYIRYSGPSTISDNLISGNATADCTTCWDHSAIFVESGETTINNNLIAYNLVGGIVIYGTYLSIVVENIVIHNQGIALNAAWGESWTISHNIFSDNTIGIDAGAVNIDFCSVNMSYNSILRNTAPDNAALDYAGYDEGSNISANTIIGNIDQSAPGNLNAVSITGHPLFNDNNIYNNTGYALNFRSAQGTANLNAENNWWGTSSSSAIQALIHDWFDDSTYSIVDFSPYRSVHNLDAPVSPPTGLNVTPGLTSLGLSWAANPESDVIGYKIYYDTDGKYPYTGTGADQGASPINVGNVLNFSLTGLPVGVYHVSVTAYDTAADGTKDQTDGNESWFAVDATGMVGQAPQAEFSATPTSGIVPLLVNFTNESTGLYDTCEWDFGDGSTSTSCSNPSHTYTMAGVFTVTLTVDGPSGEDVLSKPGYITVNHALFLPGIMR